MRFIVYIDANLSWRVANLVRTMGHDPRHVATLGELNADDGKIWKRAESENAVVITKDRDFLQFCGPDSGAILLLLEGQNAKRSVLLEELAEKLPVSFEKLSSGSYFVRIS